MELLRGLFGRSSDWRSASVPWSNLFRPVRQRMVSAAVLEWLRVGRATRSSETSARGAVRTRWGQVFVGEGVVLDELRSDFRAVLPRPKNSQSAADMESIQSQVE